MEILGPIEAYMGTAKLNTSFIRQKCVEPNDGAFNAKDPIAAIMGTTPSEANKWVKRKVGPSGPAGDAKGFMSRKYVVVKHDMVILLNFVLYKLLVLI
jgi:hypothetical protein